MIKLLINSENSPNKDLNHGCLTNGLFIINLLNINKFKLELITKEY